MNSGRRNRLLNFFVDTLRGWILNFRLARSSKKLLESSQKLEDSIRHSSRELDLLADSYQNIRKERADDILFNSIIAVDFDGTLCEDKWPEIGELNIELILWLLWRQKNGARIILWTCRENESLTKAVKVCEDHGLYFDAVNESLPETVRGFNGVITRKVFADEYIDDRNSRTYWKLPFHPINK